MKGLEMGHFGGGTGFKITGDQCHRVPDVEVEGIKKKNISTPQKTGSIWILGQSLYENRNLLDIVISRMHLDTAIELRFWTKTLCVAHPSYCWSCWPQRANRSPLKWLQRLRRAAAPSLRVASQLFCLCWLASISCKPSSQPCCMPDSSSCCLFSLPSDPVSSAQTN